MKICIKINLHTVTVSVVLLVRKYWLLGLLVRNYLYEELTLRPLRISSLCIGLFRFNCVLFLPACTCAMADATITIYGKPPQEPTQVTLPRLFREYRLFTYCDCRDAFRLYKTCHAVNRDLGGEWERQRLQVWQKATSVFWQCSPTVRATYLAMPYDELRMHIELWTAHGRDIPAELAPAVLAMMGLATAPPAFVGQCTAPPKAPTPGWMAALDTSWRCFAHKQLKSEADQLALALLQGAAAATGCWCCWLLRLRLHKG